jgi:hypothetical protein
MSDLLGVPEVEFNGAGVCPNVEQDVFVEQASLNWESV